MVFLGRVVGVTLLALERVLGDRTAKAPLLAVHERDPNTQRAEIDAGYDCHCRAVLRGRQFCRSPAMPVLALSVLIARWPTPGGPFSPFRARSRTQSQGGQIETYGFRIEDCIAGRKPGKTSVDFDFILESAQRQTPGGSGSLWLNETGQLVISLALVSEPDTVISLD